VLSWFEDNQWASVRCDSFSVKSAAGLPAVGRRRLRRGRTLFFGAGGDFAAAFAAHPHSCRGAIHYKQHVAVLANGKRRRDLRLFLLRRALPLQLGTGTERAGRYTRPEIRRVSDWLGGGDSHLKTETTCSSFRQGKTDSRFLLPHFRYNSLPARLPLAGFVPPARERTRSNSRPERIFSFYGLKF